MRIEPNSSSVEATAIVLAGGKSYRMGQNKALLDLGGRPLIEHVVTRLRQWFTQILVSAQHAQDYAFLGCPVIVDQIQDQGPLMGIASALEASDNELNLVVPCDVADFPDALVRMLLQESIQADENVDGVVPITSDFFIQPLFAVYRKSVLPAIWAAYRRGERRIMSFYDQCLIKFIPLPEEIQIYNLNIVEDYKRLLGQQTTGQDATVLKRHPPKDLLKAGFLPSDRSQ